MPASPGRSMFTGRIVRIMQDDDRAFWTCGDLGNALSRSICGLPMIHGAENRQHPDQVVYNAFSKHLHRMVDPESRWCFPPFQRRGGRYCLLSKHRDLTLLDVDWTPRAPQVRAAESALSGAIGHCDSRSTQPERDLLPLALEAAGFTCCGCGVVDYRPCFRLWQPDLVRPASKGGEAVLGNVAAVCWPCNNRKGAGTYKELWERNLLDGAMWDREAAHAALKRCVELGEIPQ